MNVDEWVVLWRDLGVLERLGLCAVFVYFALFFKLVWFFDLDKKLLSMRSYLGAGSGLNKVLYFFPVFSIEFESIEELLVFFFSPSAAGFGL